MLFESTLVEFLFFSSSIFIFFQQNKKKQCLKKVNNQLDSSQCEVLILGAGIAGASAAFHLSRSGAKNIKVLEMGTIGLGNQDKVPLVNHAIIRDGDNDEKDVAFSFAKSSGTAVFQDEYSGTIKMIVNIFPCSASTFINNNGIDNAKRYLRLAHIGLELEKSIAKEVLSDVKNQLTELGSLYVCLEEDVSEFEREYYTLLSLGAKDIELWDKKKTQENAGLGFSLGIFFPNDAVIDSTAYAKGLLNASIKTGFVNVIENCSPAVSVNSLPNKSAITTLEDGTSLISNFCIVSTGGLFVEKNIAGILTPCWSYLVSIPEPKNKLNESSKIFKFSSPNSMNFFSWNFTHDWCLTKGHLRCSGEDHYSALKPPRQFERCKALTDWTLEKLPYLIPENIDDIKYNSRYGIYSETPDHAPLVGIPHPDSRVCYLLGCNAWGQSSLSYCSSLIPKILGYQEMDNESNDLFQCINIRRYALLDAVLGKPK